MNATAAVRGTIRSMDAPLKKPKKPGFAKRFLVALLDAVPEALEQSAREEAQRPTEYLKRITWTGRDGHIYYGIENDYRASQRVH